MLTAEESLEFILSQVEKLGEGDKPYERAAYRAMMHLNQRWAEPTDRFIDDGLEMADVQRHFADLQHAYLKALFGDAAE
jgi:hypothetical protein